MDAQITNISPPNNFISNGIKLDATYQYVILTDKYIDQVTDLFTRVFCQSEPMTKYLAMDETKYRKFAKSVTEQASQDQLSVIALDNEKVIAIALVEDMALPGEIIEFDPKFTNILSLLETLGQRYFSTRKIQEQEIAHLFITAVDEKYRHQGLSKQVNFRAMDRAASQGFKYMYSELTNYLNEKGIIPHLKNPSKLIGACLYKDFIYEDTKPFEHLAGGANSYLWCINENSQDII